MKNTKTTSCRLCKKEKFREILYLGNQYVNDFPSEWPTKGHKCPLVLVECLGCSLVQLLHSAPPGLLYRDHYWYKSGLNNVIKKDLKEIAEQAIIERGHPRGNVLDIGANDGTLLSYFPKGYTKWGVEPAKNLHAQLKKNADVVIDDFWPLETSNKYDIITAIGMFYDVEDPVAFLTAARQQLKDGGVFVAQLMTAKQMVENNDIGNICHEHLEYYTWKSLKSLFTKARLEIYKVEENGINGGSYRIFAKKKTGRFTVHVDHKEDEIDWDGFARDVKRLKRVFADVLDGLTHRKLKVYIYGASTKGNTIIQYLKVGPDVIKAAIDKDPEKFGKYMQTGIPITDDANIKDADVLWCIPYGFVGAFKKKEKFRGRWMVISPDVNFL